MALRDLLAGRQSQCCKTIGESFELLLLGLHVQRNRLLCGFVSGPLTGIMSSLCIGATGENRIRLSGHMNGVSTSDITFGFIDAALNGADFSTDIVNTSLARRSAGGERSQKGEDKDSSLNHYNSLSVWAFLPACNQKYWIIKPNVKASPPGSMWAGIDVCK